MIKQIFHHYETWECYKNGMWRKVPPDDQENLLKQAIEFTSDHIKYGKAMIKAVDNWTITLEHNLTDNSINKRAYIGHCAVCIELGIPEYITRMAWHYLTDLQRNLANKEADKAIYYWEQKHIQKLYNGQIKIRFECA